MRWAICNAMNGTDCTRFEDYFHLLRTSGTDSRIWEDLLAMLNTGETYFFRDPAQISVLRDNILPEVISRRRHDRCIRVWSAGCATGEEPYTLAMLLSELISDIRQWNIFILATDINKKHLKKGRTGVFRNWSFRQTDPAMQSRYFSSEPEGFAIDPGLREMVTFSYLNLSEDCYPSLSTSSNAMDLILFRNVAIYQPEHVCQAVVKRFYQCLVFGGWLMVGAAETGIPAYASFAGRNISGITVFQKSPDTEPCRPVRQQPSAPENKAIHKSKNDAKKQPAKTASATVKTSKGETKVAENGPVLLYEKGMSLLKKKDYPEAIAAFQACLALDFSFGKALCQIARAYANMGRPDEALPYCWQAIERDLLMADAHYILALVHLEKGNVSEAISCLKKLLFLEPRYILAHFHLAIIFQKREQMAKEADRHRRQVVRLASRIPSDSILPGSDDLTAGQLLTMAKAIE